MKKSTQQSLDALSRGINAELAAFVFYKRAAEKMKNREIADMLGKLAGEEKDHYWTLEAEYDSLVRSEKWVSYNDIMRKSGLPEIPADMSDDHKKRLKKLDETNSAGKILEMALELEQAARDFYLELVNEAPDPTAREIYAFLGKFEQAHVKVIESWISKL